MENKPRLFKNPDFPPLINDFLKEENFYEVYNYYNSILEDYYNEYYYLCKKTNIEAESLDLLKAHIDIVNKNLEIIKNYYYKFKDQVEELSFNDIESEALKENLANLNKLRDKYYNNISAVEDYLINRINIISDNLNSDLKNISMVFKKDDYNKILDYRARAEKMLTNSNIYLLELSFNINDKHLQAEEMHEDLKLMLNNYIFEIILLERSYPDYKIDAIQKYNNFKVLEKEFFRIKDEYNHYVAFIKNNLEE